MTTTDMPLLQVERIEVVYDHVILALRGVSIEVPRGGIVALLGANGAGKTTTLKAISRLLEAERGTVTGGDVRYEGASVLQHGPDRLVRAGVAQVLEGRRWFAHLSVEQNLLLGGFVDSPPRRQLQQRLEAVYDLFPRLKTRRNSLAGYTSGGEQQMVAIGRALMGRPRLVLLDEPSMGLAPLVVQEIFEAVGRLNREQGVSFLLAEQNAAIALRHAQYGYVLATGSVATQGSAAELLARDDVRRFYLGDSGPGRKAFIDAQHVRSFHPHPTSASHP